MIKFILMLLGCVIVHELSHYFAAKAVKARIKTVSIGFGKPFFKWTHGLTTYQITPWIFGGYCEMKGENCFIAHKDAFCNLPYIKKLIIVLAGCFANIKIGVTALIIGNIYGNFDFVYFGTISTMLGVTNLLPIPALDGSFIFSPILQKIYGRKRGWELIIKFNKLGFKILMIINIISIPYIIYLISKGAFNV